MKQTRTRRRRKTDSGDLRTVLLFYVLPFIVINSIIFYLFTAKPKVEITVGDTEDYLTTTATVRIRSLFPTKNLVIAKDGHRYDRFRSRVMYPIRNPRGQVIGFGARTMVAGEEPKYLNSPETPVYHKSQELYGLFEAREAIHKKGRAIVCEGYMDVIQMSQAGFLETFGYLLVFFVPLVQVFACLYL